MSVDLTVAVVNKQGTPFSKADRPISPQSPKQVITAESEISGHKVQKNKQT
jgi:hypothetical protein